MTMLKRLLIGFIVLAFSLTTSVAVFAVDVSWTGNGADNGVCNDIRYDPSAPQGQQVWLFILNSPDGSGNYLLDATFNTGSVNDVVGTQQGNGSVHFFVTTPEGAVLLSATATGGTDQGGLRVSHCSANPSPLQVTKTANTTYIRTLQWNIVKSVTPEVLNMFTGDSGMVTYTVEVTQTGYVDSGWAVSGSISVYNPSAVYAATVTGVTDDVSGYGGVAVNCPVGFPYLLGPGQTLQCSYSSGLPDGSTRTNTATAATTGVVPGGSGSAQVAFGAPTSTVNGTVDVNDTNGSSWQFGGSGSQSYVRLFTCDADEGTHNNTATIVQTGQSDSASVTVNCYELQVTKNALTSLTRTYNWNITKDEDAEYAMFMGDSTNHGYTITVDLVDYTDSNWAVNGTIQVYNPAPIPAPINAVADLVSPGIGASVNCGVSFPYILSPGGTLMCTYGAALPDASQRLNTATAVLQNVPSGTTNFTGTAVVDFSNALITEVDPQVNVTDDYGTPAAGGDDLSFGPFAGDDSANYNRTFDCPTDPSLYVGGPYQYVVNNTATIDETGDSDDATVTVTCYVLEVTKDAQPALTRTYTWDITKDEDAEYSMFIGDSTNHGYTITVDLVNVTDSDWAVSGNIHVHNPAPIPAPLTGVADVVSPAISANVDCNVTFPYNLAANGTLNCTYSVDLPNADTRTNTATVTLQNSPAGTTDFSGSAEVDFANAIITEIDPQVNVTDDYGSPAGDSDDLTFGPFTGDDSANYGRDFDCPTDPNLYVDGALQYVVNNTATIDETGDSDDATVTVNCYAPLVSKTAETDYTRTWEWTITKSVDQSSLTLSAGQIWTLNYTVVVSGTSTDSDWAVSGVITVENPNPDDDMTVSVADSLAGAVIDCGDGAGDTTLVVLAGGNATCSYSAALGGAVDGTNTATATLNGVGFSGSAGYDFGDPTSHIDECVNVSDTYAGDLGIVCAGNSDTTFSQTFTYTRNVSFPTCGSYTVDNTASFTTNDTGSTGSDSETVVVNIPCLGCTLTQGYWKTHSSFGPAPYDDTWALLPGGLGANTSFFLSGNTWYGVFWTAPQGNPYYNLAHQYMAARLNILNGAAHTVQVDNAINWATTFFNTYTPAQATTVSRQIRNTMIQTAATLASYNEGTLRGNPGHCSE